MEKIDDKAYDAFGVAFGILFWVVAGTCIFLAIYGVAGILVPTLTLSWWQLFAGSLVGMAIFGVYLCHQIDRAVQ